mmetsp:Transcript_23624/g.49877  ORF Transcript_23624/g.49877 Transcript_23624/m.49877 type:complete len:245 (-) Transcript_23624:87-821(-)
MRFRGQIGVFLATPLQPVEAFRVVFDGHFEIRRLVRIIPAFFVHLVHREGRLALPFQPLELGLDARHHPLDVGVAGVETRCQLERLERPRNVTVLHLVLRLATEGGDLLGALELRQVLLHLFEVGVGGVDGQAGFQGFDAAFEVVLGLEGRGEAEVALDEGFVGLDAGAGGGFHFFVVRDLFVAGGHVGPVGGDVGVDGGGFLVFGDGGFVAAFFEVFVAFGFEGFCSWVAWHGDGVWLDSRSG